MGPSRSLRGAYALHREAEDGPGGATTGPRRGLSVPGTWKRWSRQHDWVFRAQAYDGHLDGVGREAREAVVVAGGEGWAQRREELRAMECALGKRLLAIAEKAVMEFEKRENFADLTTKDLERLVLTGSKLQRLSIGLATERSEDVHNLDEMSEEELAALAAGQPAGPSASGNGRAGSMH
ncbi:MAG: hypothetical protein EA398_13735 [Deltaproteobacteria bacterium]|nr:MAG: hypothetical protein EA398_13735 [Deltaproteobacteria bacterium]